MKLRQALYGTTQGARVPLRLSLENTLGSDVAVSLPAGNTARIGKGLPDTVASVLREPLLQFLLLGAVIFLVAHGVEIHRRSAQRQIVIDQDVVTRLVRLHVMQMGEAPSSEALERMISDYVHDEVTYREALQMGLDQDDEIVRRRMIQKLEFLTDDSRVIPEPDESELRRYYAEHSSAFAAPARLSFYHLYFNPEAGGDAAAQARAEAVLRKLRLQGSGHEASLAEGEHFALQNSYSAMTPSELTQVFGAFPIVEGLLNAPANRWIGPLRSGYGWHLVYVTEHRDAAVPPFEAARDEVRTAWLDARREALNQQSFDEMSRRYEVVRADRLIKP